MLTETQVTHYHNEGYVVPDYRLPAETLDAIKEDHDLFLKRHPEFCDYCPNLLALDTSFLKYARDPQIVNMVEQVLGADFALWNCSFFAKPARTGSRTPWHQDGEYWPIRPVATCTVWIAVDDSTAENGCLRVIPGSHKAKKLVAHETNDSPGRSIRQELPASVFDESAAVDITLEAGQMSMHDVFLFHGSEPNTSDNPRRGMTLRIMPLTSTFDRALGQKRFDEVGDFNHAERTLFLLRGSDQTGRNDFVVRL